MDSRSLLAGVMVLLGVTAPVACGPGQQGNGPAPGPGGPGETPPQACEKPADCPSKVCTAAKVCAAPSPTDGAMNGDETDVDCGGAAPKCETDKKCKIGNDCTSSVCKDGVCHAPTATDGAKNGDETDIDCGGLKAPKCVDGKACKVRNDCASDVCDAGKCKAPDIDGVKNGTETDVDCGGLTAPRCADGLACLGDGDCTSDVCKGSICQAPSPTDGKKNGVETDVDCGGAGNPKCATDQLCLAHSDCASDGCAYSGKCAVRRSCTVQNGGDTCGLGGQGGVGAAAWESCCTTAPAGNGGVQMDKYKVTAGRMRAFMTRINGNVRGFVQTARAAGQIKTVPPSAVSPVVTGASLMSADWDMYLPTSMSGNANAGELSDTEYQQNNPYLGIWTSAYRHLGGTIFAGQNLSLQGCSVASYGTHTYWMPNQVQTDYFGDVPHAYSQAEYDKKAYNCPNYLVSQAFCIWDGGRLETFDEWLAAIGPTAMPWGATPSMKSQGDRTYFAFRYPTATDVMLRDPVYGAPANLIPSATQSVEYGVFGYSYEYPNLVCDPGFAWCDYAAFIAAPGRTKGRGPWGHADLAGNGMEITSDITTNTTSPKTSRMRWATNGSFEGHGYSKGISWNGFTLVNKYGKSGARCVYPP